MMKKSLILLLPFFISFAIASASLAASRDASPTEVAEPAPVVERTRVAEPAPVVKRTKVAEPAPVVERTKVVEPAPVVERTKVAEQRQVAELASTSGTSIINPDSMLPTSGTRVTDPSSSAAAGPTPHPSPREEPQEISLEEKDFIKNLKEEDKRSWSANGRQYQVIKSQGCENSQISLIGDEQFICNNNQWAGPIGKKLSDKDDISKLKLDDKTLVNIKRDVASEWEKAKQRLAEMSDAERSAMRASNAKYSAEVIPPRFVDEALNDLLNSLKNLKKAQALKDEEAYKNIGKTTVEAQEQKIWSDFFEKTDALVAEYHAGMQDSVDAYLSSPDYINANAIYDEAEQLYWDIYQSGLKMANDDYVKQIEPFTTVFDTANIASDEQYDLDIGAAEAEEDPIKSEEMFAVAEIDRATAKAEAQATFDEKTEPAKALLQATIYALQNLHISQIEPHQNIYYASIQAVKHIKDSEQKALAAEKSQKILEAEQERDEALAALESESEDK